MEQKIVAETPRLILRRFEESDLKDLHEYLSDPEVVKYEPYRAMTLDEARENLKWRISTGEMIAVVLKDTGKLIGNVYLGKREFDSLELGYVFNRHFWGKGFAAEACGKAVELVFDAGIHRIYAECDPMNTASWQLLERLGFRREGHLRQNVYFGHYEMGKPIWKDTYLYAKLADEG